MSFNPGLVASPHLDLHPETDIVMRRVHAFFTQGRAVDLSNLPLATIETVPGEPARTSDPNGRYQVGQMYGQYFELAKPRFALPLLLWHGGGMTGATWGDTPDGRPGWHDYFMRLGFNTCVSDAVERGRSSWAPYPSIFPTAPEHRTINQAWSIFRFGPGDGYRSGSTFDNVRFPVAFADELAKQFVARWPGNLELALTAYGELVDKFGRSIIVAHSEGARHALHVAATHPEKVAALVLIEPAGGPQLDDSFAEMAASVPHLVVWGDHFDRSVLWQGYRAAAEQWFSKVRGHGGRVDCMDLPAMGIIGNSHLLMMDDNAADIAQLTAQWIAEQTA